MKSIPTTLAITERRYTDKYGNFRESIDPDFIDESTIFNWDPSIASILR
jgi:hypothetical protein